MSEDPNAPPYAINGALNFFGVKLQTPKESGADQHLPHEREANLLPTHTSDPLCPQSSPIYIQSMVDAMKQAGVGQIRTVPQHTQRLDTIHRYL